MRKIIGLVILSIMVMGSVYAAETASNISHVYTEDKLGIAVTKDQSQFVVKLKSNPTTGYSWFLRGYDSEIIAPVKHHFEHATDRKLMGAPGFETWTFQVKEHGFIVPQQTAIRFVYARPWENDVQAKQVVFQVSTLPYEGGAS